MRFHGIYILYKEPLVVACFAGGREEKAVQKINKKAHILYHPTWLWSVRTLPWVIRKLYFSNPLHQAHFICSAKEELNLFSKITKRVALSSISSFINEHECNIDPKISKIYKAIYCGQMADYKRFELAAQVKNLFVQTYGKCRNSRGEFDLYKFAPYLKDCDYNHKFVTRAEVIEKLNSAQVGLALSAKEGAMLAFVEYLLCGLPVVSTPAQGGRELFFDERFVKIVKPDASLVASAVEDLIKKNIDPSFIREQTLLKLKEQRFAYAKYLAEIVGKTSEEIYEHLFSGEQGINKYFFMLDSTEYKEMVTVHVG